MARKCDTAKYRKRRERERLSAVTRDRRIEAIAFKHRVEVQERVRKAELARLADPRRQLVQRLVNILCVRLSSNPVYQLMQISKLFGIDMDEVVRDSVSGMLETKVISLRIRR